jgi:hypothetical protein
MAIVTQIDRVNKDTRPHPTTTSCSCCTIQGDNGKTYVQIETYGSPSRQFPGKVSQSIQFDEHAAAQLKRVIEEAFPHLK